MTNENSTIINKQDEVIHNPSLLVSYKDAEGGIIQPPSVVFLKPKRQVSQVFIHCSASSNPKHDDINVIRQWHIDNGWGKNLEYQDKVGYHYFIKKDGTLEIGRNLEIIPTAQKESKTINGKKIGGNAGTIAICLHGGGGTPPVNDFTRAQYNTLESICKAINQAYKGKITFHGHCEVSAKACPVFDYRKILNLQEDGYMKQ